MNFSSISFAQDISISEKDMSAIGLDFSREGFGVTKEDDVVAHVLWRDIFACYTAPLAQDQLYSCVEYHVKDEEGHVVGQRRVTIPWH